MSGLFDDFRSEFNKPNNTLVQLILVNTVVFLVLLLAKVGFTMGGQLDTYYLIRAQLMIPGGIVDFLHKPWTLFTYFFAHDEIFHILYNMLFLYWFGRLIDEYLGNRRLVGLYIMGGLAGGLLYLLMYNTVPYFQNTSDSARMLGASAAAFSVAVGAATLLPNYTFHLLFFGPVRIKYIVFFFIVMSIAQSAGANAGGNLAHLGGALMGFMYVKLLQNGTDLGRPIYWVMEGWSNILRPKPAVKVSYRQRSSASTQATSYAAAGGQPSTLSTPDQDEVDMILDKISRSGYESLTREEKQKLFRASQRN
ncbi:rhomboid family intramembrane serine protease [Spirosoma utsteinense]|uniref:Membrane associated rhomboid family serine protease n=1 Tax=Spirosoma utsteinense TaxID=2585773 RepID=A0ABR6W1Y1_9BACT|nr:rhomboid family intramembrane serine protease [Spirosoma utsteinense]MBC3783689.1 membrane associated rhomboid family serine protease [Spirosoma utsteinense]MBC3790168.1 membrane associated rhomboid family serine protease [Spirosoma utsteinense]